MPYASGRVIHDADAHIMEVPGFLEEHLEAKYRARRDRQRAASRTTAAAACIVSAPRRARPARTIPSTSTNRRSCCARTGTRSAPTTRHDRPQSIDLLGFASQLMFTTALLNFSSLLEGKGDVDLIYAVARAHTRHMVDFCSVDRRLLPTGYVPLADFERTARAAREAIALGAKALLIPSRCPDGHSPSHIGFDPLWAAAQEAGLPIVFHVGGGGKLLEEAYFNNGLPPVPDFHGGDDNFKSIDYMAIAYPPMKALTALIVDRVLDRFPRLKFGVIEQGASWVPGWMRNMDSAHTAFYKNEERLQKMSLKPSEFVARQVRVTPYPHEDAGWIIANSGDGVCLFSSDYPHVEGGRNPIKRFEASMAAAGTSERQKQALLLRQFHRPDGRGPGARAEGSGMSGYTTLLTERTGPVLKITTNRPEVLNAQSRILLEELDDAFLRAVDDEAVRVIILAGAGKHFSAGHDLGSPQEMEDQKKTPLEPGFKGEYRRLWERFFENTMRWRDLPKPTIAQVQGYCIMGGMMIASACDLIIASDDAQFADRAVKWGGAHVQYFSMPWDFGPRKTKEYLFTGAVHQRRPGRAGRPGQPRGAAGQARRRDDGARPGDRRARSLCAEARQGVGQRDAGCPGMAGGDGERLQELHADHPAQDRDGHLRPQGPRKGPEGPLWNSQQDHLMSSPDRERPARSKS